MDQTVRKTLHEWLQHQQRTHPQQIAMGLERVREVAQRMQLARPGKQVATVAGTNGKGSTVAFIEAIARAGGLRVGAFTSPHLLRYNERVRIDGEEASDAALVAVFERIEAARGEIPLTVFEFGTLAALALFADAGLDLAILEVGLGGRLDAVNIIDADVAVLTTVDLDHMEYLGYDRETIGADKAGVFRAGKPCVIGERDPPSSVLRQAYAIGAFAIRAHADYLVEVQPGGWTWREPGFELELPLPGLLAPAQLDNAAAAIAALRALRLELPDRAFAEGVRAAKVSGRLQLIAQAPEVMLDVAHNGQAARQLADWLRAHPKPTRVVFGALRDKDIGEVVSAIDPLVLEWHLAGIHDAGLRGGGAELLAARLRPLVPDWRMHRHHGAAEAMRAAIAASGADERVLVFGSFHTVGDALRGAAGAAGQV
ncbi:MAG: bifunctional tetrahydrofolate synthase/dihydrofolate synthase [Arenimonas sp.]